MGIWDDYNERLTFPNEKTSRDRVIEHSKRDIQLYMNSSPSFKKNIVVNDNNTQDFLIYKTKNSWEKTFCTMPDESVNMGDYLFYTNQKWLVNFVDIDNEIYTTGTIIVCNKFLKWQDENGFVIKRLVNIKKRDNDSLYEQKLITTLDGTLDVTLPYDDDTKKIDVDKRFMVELINGKPKVYKIVSVDYLSNTLDEHGVIHWYMEQDEFNPETDSVENMIADFKPDIDNENENITTNNNENISVTKRCDIKFDGSSNLKIGGSWKLFKSLFYDNNDDIIDNIQAVWTIESDFECETQIINNDIKIKLSDEVENGAEFKIILSDTNSVYYKEIVVKGVIF